jgi:amidophosphoribosyltransferase
MCLIVGISSHEPVAMELYESLLHLQHRGQDTAGILTFDERMHLKVGLGHADQVFSKADLAELKGNLGIAHLRYPTSGGNSLAEIQPLITSYPYGMGLVHNGNLVNYEELKAHLKQEKRYINSLSDSELLLKNFAHHLAQHPLSKKPEELFDSICASLKDVFDLAQGAYSVITAILGVGMVVFRDPHGIRPLVMGQREKNGHTDYCFASEDIPFYSLGFDAAGDVAPGEVIFISLNGQIFRRVIQQADFNPCIFEYVYFARPDAVINHLSVYRARLHMGENLAKAWKKKYPDILPDVVVPIPFTSNTPALSFAHELGVRYSEGLYKNAFIGRTFIMPSQVKRVKSVRTKFHPQITELKNKTVLLLDDSIVRGTTSIEIVKMVREAGAKKIYMVSACPPLKFPCYYGINIPTREELIANQYQTEAEIAKALGVDILFYQSEADLKEAVLRDQTSSHIKNPCMACLNGRYFSGKPNGESNNENENESHADRQRSSRTCHRQSPQVCGSV